MARGSNQVIEWGGVLLVVFFFGPRLLQAFAGSNARTAVQYNPGAALSAQEARAINTAGLSANTALANVLARLLGSQKAGGSGGRPSAGGASGGGAGGRQTVTQANNATDPNIREPDFQAFIAGTGPYAGQVNPSDLVPPNIPFGEPGAGGVDWASLFGTPSAPVLGAPDVGGLDFAGDTSSLFSVLGEDAATMPAPDLANTDGQFDFSSFDFYSPPDPGLDTTAFDTGADFFDYGGLGGGSTFDETAFQGGDFAA